MKNLLYLLLLIPFCIHGSNSLEDLTQAIKQSDPYVVSLITSKIKLSSLEKEMLLDLAKEVIKHHRQEWKAYARPWAIPAKEAILLCLGNFLFASKTILKTIRNQTVSEDFLVLGLVITAAGYTLMGLIKRYYAQKLSRLYDQAVDVKQLIYKTACYRK